MNPQDQTPDSNQPPASNQANDQPTAASASFRAAALLLLVISLLTVLVGSARAQERVITPASFANNSQPLKIDAQVGQTRVVDFDQPYERVSVSDNKIAEVVPVSERQILINGLAFGQVNIVAWQKVPAGQTPRMLIFDIYVQVNLTLIDNQIKILFPKENIQLSQVNNSVVLSGNVSRPEMAEQAQKIIEATGLKVNNLIKAPILDAAQVQLQIRVAEVNRSVFKELSTAYGVANSTVPAYISSGGPGAVGANSRLTNPQGVNATAAATSAVNLLLGNLSGATGVLGFIRALQQRGALRELAEPNLIAMHGHKASFLAGGEFPIPIIQSVSQGQSAITIIFKEFGVKLNFQPTILDENHIRLELEPEVSSLDFASGVKIEGLVIPGLRVRRAKTVVELRDGQSFALAGLIDNTEQVNLSKVPLLGDVPILGELFKSRSFQRNETELMFLVTVKTVEPLNPDQIPKLPGVAELKPTSPSSSAIPSASLEGQAGHSVAPRTNQTNNTTVSVPVTTVPAAVTNSSSSSTTTSSKTTSPTKPPEPIAQLRTPVESVAQPVTALPTTASAGAASAAVAPTGSSAPTGAPISAPTEPTAAPPPTAGGKTEKAPEQAAAQGVKTNEQQMITLRTSAGLITIPVGATSQTTPVVGSGHILAEVGATSAPAKSTTTPKAATTPKR